MTHPEQTYSPLAWRIAQRAKFDQPNVPEPVVRAAVMFEGLLVQGWGSTTTAAMRNLAEHLDEWGCGS